MKTSYLPLWMKDELFSAFISLFIKPYLWVVSITFPAIIGRKQFAINVPRLFGTTYGSPVPKRGNAAGGVRLDSFRNRYPWPYLMVWASFSHVLKHQQWKIFERDNKNASTTTIFGRISPVIVQAKNDPTESISIYLWMPEYWSNADIFTQHVMMSYTQTIS